MQVHAGVGSVEHSIWRLAQRLNGLIYLPQTTGSWSHSPLTDPLSWGPVGALNPFQPAPGVSNQLRSHSDATATTSAI